MPAAISRSTTAIAALFRRTACTLVTQAVTASARRSRIIGSEKADSANTTNANREPTALPTRSSNGRPNIVAYALSTNHALGTPMFERSGRTNIDRFNRVCSSYGSNDQAQEAFLMNGGPQRDRKGMDPDGDGFACYWDPTPFRTARGG